MAEAQRNGIHAVFKVKKNVIYIFYFNLQKNNLPS